MSSFVSTYNGLFIWFPRDSKQIDENGKVPKPRHWTTDTAKSLPSTFWLIVCAQLWKKRN